MKVEIETLKELLYDKTKEEVLSALESINCPHTLHMYMMAYNWDNGFEIPDKVLSKPCCELSTALLIFYQAEGIRYLMDKEEVRKSSLMTWAAFLENLYERIMRGEFSRGEIMFKVSKVQLYRLKKVLRPNEEVFITAIGE